MSLVISHLWEVKILQFKENDGYFLILFFTSSPVHKMALSLDLGGALIDDQE